jgi:hypothetical protein
MPEHDDSTPPSTPGTWSTSSSDVHVMVHAGTGTALQLQAWRRLWSLLLADGSPSHCEAAVTENPAPVDEISAADSVGDSHSST